MVKTEVRVNWESFRIKNGKTKFSHKMRKVDDRVAVLRLVRSTKNSRNILGCKGIN